jgi:plastocyanin
MMPRAPIAAIIVLMALASPSLCPSPADAVVNVAVDDFFFEPRDIVIPVGETVTWTVINGFHSTTSGLDSNDPNAGALWDSPWLFPGGDEIYSYTFTSVGLFQYFCRVHDSLNMKGTVTVSRVRLARPKQFDGTEPASWGMIKALYR